MNSKRYLPLCFIPWFEVDLLYTGGVQPCCENGTPMGNIRQENILNIWNAKPYQELRSKLAQGDVYGTPCGNCLYRLTHPAHIYPRYDYGRGELIANFRKAEEHFLQGDTVLSSKPLSYRMDFTHECNLRCKMCFQDHAPMETRFPKDFIEKFFKEEFYVHAGGVILVGGEPLVIPESIDFLRRLAEVDPGECQLTLSTNGLLLDRFWKEIKTFRRVVFAISLDSCDPKTYESIRVGGKWEQIMANLEEINHIRHTETQRDWRLIFGNIIMKSTIVQLPRMLRFGHKHKFDNRFGPIFGLKNTDENIFIYNWLLDDLLGWKDILDQAIELTDDFCPNYPTRSNLVGLRHILLMKPWVTRLKAYIVRRFFGPEALSDVLKDKFTRYFFPSAKMSAGTNFLMAFEKLEYKCKNSFVTRQAWNLFVYSSLVLIVILLGIYRHFPLVMRRRLNIRQKIFNYFIQAKPIKGYYTNA